MKPRWGKKKVYTIPGRTIELRSGFEAKIGENLDKAGVVWEYESVSYPLAKPLVGARCRVCGSKDVVKGARYTPDFRVYFQDKDIPWTVVIEAKGRLTAKDRKTILAFSKIALDHKALYFVLLQRDNTLSKGSKTRYSEWCAKNGITYAVSAAGIVPPEWYSGAP